MNNEGDSVLIEIFGLGDVAGPELDVEGIGILKILDLHGVNERSKKALCTIPAQRRMRPSPRSGRCRIDSKYRVNFTGLFDFPGRRL
jgi:hypothetical protein